MAEKGVQPVTRPGDWLKISDYDLLRRLNPTTERSAADTPKADRALMQPIEGPSNQKFGRAFIAPSRYSWSGDCGWITVSGLRAAKLNNVEGVLLGEALTAARDAAQPLATREALAQWASRQAELIVASVRDEERQARSAEVVLECDGEIGDLKIVKWGSDWMSSSEFEDRLRSSTEIAISFDGEFDYDEDRDDVHPKDFREDFRYSENIALVLKHDGNILKGSNNSWPRSLTGKPKANESRVAAYVRNLIQRVWGQDLQEDEEDRVVGTVRHSDITRSVVVFRALDENGPF
jgi:hypothetical protein